MSEHVALRLLLLEAVVTWFVTGFGMSLAKVTSPGAVTRRAAAPPLYSSILPLWDIRHAVGESLAGLYGESPTNTGPLILGLILGLAR
jgi:hypothetical protein